MHLEGTVARRSTATEGRDGSQNCSLDNPFDFAQGAAYCRGCGGMTKLLKAKISHETLPHRL
jgi:hypothetical protein